MRRLLQKKKIPANFGKAENKYTQNKKQHITQAHQLNKPEPLF